VGCRRRRGVGGLYRPYCYGEKHELNSNSSKTGEKLSEQRREGGKTEFGGNWVERANFEGERGAGAF
jgi:hypothetical protein